MSLISFVKHNYNILYLRYWLLQHRRDNQVFTDDTGNKYEINNLLQIPDKHLVSINVSILWKRTELVAPWGSSTLTLKKAYNQLTLRDYAFRSIGRLISDTKSTNHEEEHLSRIMLFVISLQIGLKITPLLVDNQEVLIDGYHRLVALRYIDLPTFIAWKYSKIATSCKI